MWGLWLTGWQPEHIFLRVLWILPVNIIHRCSIFINVCQRGKGPLQIWSHPTATVSMHVLLANLSQNKFKNLSFPSSGLYHQESKTVTTTSLNIYGRDS